MVRSVALLVFPRCHPHDQLDARRDDAGLAVLAGAIAEPAGKGPPGYAEGFTDGAIRRARLFVIQEPKDRGEVDAAERGARLPERAHLVADRTKPAIQSMNATWFGHVRDAAGT